MMPTGIASVVGSVSRGLPVRAIQVAVAQVRSARDVTNMFLGVCTTVADLTDEEKQVRDKLGKRVQISSTNETTSRMASGPSA